MAIYRPVTINRASFAFCRLSMAIIIWLAFIFKSEILLLLTTSIFLLSAILRIQKAPMIRLYDITAGRIIKSGDIIIDSNSMFFAHSIACILSLICLLLVTLVDESWTWRTVLLFAILKSVSALGFCPAARFYNCTLNGNCCIKSSKNA
ncbi:MAG TPA: DUF4395 family protein [Lentimicrobium sp.]|nr:DUF4395 family protein [Lentimicrobium sp.]